MIGIYVKRPVQSQMFKSMSLQRLDWISLDKPTISRNSTILPFLAGEGRNIQTKSVFFEEIKFCKVTLVTWQDEKEKKKRSDLLEAAGTSTIHFIELAVAWLGILLLYHHLVSTSSWTSNLDTSANYLGIFVVAVWDCMIFCKTTIFSHSHCETQSHTVHWLSSSIFTCLFVRPSVRPHGDISIYLHCMMF